VHDGAGAETLPESVAQVAQAVEVACTDARGELGLDAGDHAVAGLDSPDSPGQLRLPENDTSRPPDTPPASLNSHQHPGPAASPPIRGTNPPIAALHEVMRWIQAQNDPRVRSFLKEADAYLAEFEQQGRNR
jgi:hypothetical protein